MPQKIETISDDFWNIRGTYRIGGVINVGTHMSLVQRSNGRFIMLDACDISERVRHALDELTDHGAKLDAVLHLHPFHTMYVEAMHTRYPDAQLFGTERHIAQLSGAEVIHFVQDGQDQRDQQCPAGRSQLTK